MKNIIETVSVLGVPYTIYTGTTIDFPDLCDCDGYCDTTIKRIVVFDPSENADKPGAKGDMINYQRKVIRHELIHAALYESGLSNNSSWAGDEEMVDWIAIQFGKLQALFNSAKCLEVGD